MFHQKFQEKRNWNQSSGGSWLLEQETQQFTRAWIGWASDLITTKYNYSVVCRGQSNIHIEDSHFEAPFRVPIDFAADKIWINHVNKLRTSNVNQPKTYSERMKSQRRFIAYEAQQATSVD